MFNKVLGIASAVGVIIAVIVALYEKIINKNNEESLWFLVFAVLLQLQVLKVIIEG